MNPKFTNTVPMILAGGLVLILIGIGVMARTINTLQPKPEISCPTGFICIKPENTDCWPFKGLEDVGYMLIGEFQKGRYSILAGEGKGDLMPAQSVQCKYIENGKIMAEFYPTQYWYKSFEKKRRYK